jgi:hypothetical protein
MSGSSGADRYSTALSGASILVHGFGQIRAKPLAESVRERYLAVRKPAALENLADLLGAKLRDPRSVVECLSDDVARSAATLELEHIEGALRVHREQVDKRSKVRLDLAIEYQEGRKSEDADVVSEDVLEPSLRF